MSTVVSSTTRKPCSFCKKEVESSEIGSHLMECGNKTDQCPNCKKYVRRAIFAYHYENNCASLEEPNTDVHTSTSTAATSSENNAAMPQAVNQSSHRSNIVICEFCYQECELSERPIHQETCLDNPDYHKKQQSSNIYPNLVQDQVPNYDNLRDHDLIPCELCGKYIEWRSFGKHMTVCADQVNRRLAQQTRGKNTLNNSNTTLCKHCHNPAGPFLRFHEITCFQHPRLLAFGRRLARMRVPDEHLFGWKPIM